MKIGIDIDGTITKATIVADIIATYYENFKYSDVTQYDLDKVLGISKEELIKIFKKHDDVLIKNPELNLNSVETINKWAESCEIIIITARHGSETESTIEWLSRVGINYDRLYVIHDKDKYEIVAEEGIGLFIEDKYETVIKVEEYVPETINLLIDTPYNQGSLSRQSIRVTDWDEISEVVEKVIGKELLTKVLEYERN